MRTTDPLDYCEGCETPGTLRTSRHFCGRCAFAGIRDGYAHHVIRETLRAYVLDGSGEIELEAGTRNLGTVLPVGWAPGVDPLSLAEDGVWRVFAVTGPELEDVRQTDVVGLVAALGTITDGAA